MSSPDDRRAPAHLSPRERLAQAIGKVPLLSGLDETAQRDLARCARPRRVVAGEVVIEQNEPAQALFAIEQGRLKVVAPRAGGRHATLHILQPGDVFGEVALFEQRGRTARVTALEDALLIVLDRRDVLWLVDRSPELSRRLLALMARRLRETIEHFDATTSLDVAQRLARKLLTLAEVFGTEGLEGHTGLALTLSQRDLAELVDTSRQTVNRLLGEWREQGLLRVEGGRLVLLDVAALRVLAGGGG